MSGDTAEGHSDGTAPRAPRETRRDRRVAGPTDPEGGVTPTEGAAGPDRTRPGHGQEEI